MDFRHDTVRDLADRVRNRQVAARELVAHSLERIEAIDPRVNAFVAIDAERAMADAAALDARLARGGAGRDELADALPLAGIPLGVKDLEDAAGLPTTKGSALLAGSPAATTDSVLVARLRAAGCIVVGKTNTPEHGFTADTVNAPFGATRNPWDLERSPGGSSGGSAAAVAAGMVPLATGSDGGGSIRIPAALCGLSGLKPSQGRVPNGGPTPPGSGLFSCKAPMARRIHDVALALGPAVGPHPTDPFSLPAGDEPWPDGVAGETVPTRVAWAPDMGWEVDAEVRRVTGAAVARLADAGCEVIEVDRVFRDDPTLPWFHLWTAHLLRSFGHLRGTDDWERLTPALRDQVLFAATSLGPDDVTRALDAIHLANLDLAVVLEQAPLLLSPVTAGRTPRSEHLGEVDGVETPMWVRFTYPLNLTRNPAGTVCAGFDEDGLPVGLQVIGPHHADVAVLRALASLEQVLDVDAVAPDIDPV
jgi:Asp-tRNA(Asn)/Glu-tRNA(Gln) amidotransferase A subunit family amidase